MIQRSSKAMGKHQSSNQVCEEVSLFTCIGVEKSVADPYIM